MDTRKSNNCTTSKNICFPFPEIEYITFTQWPHIIHKIENRHHIKRYLSKSARTNMSSRIRGKFEGESNSLRSRHGQDSRVLRKVRPRFLPLNEGVGSSMKAKIKYWCHMKIMGQKCGLKDPVEVIVNWNKDSYFYWAIYEFLHIRSNG